MRIMSIVGARPQFIKAAPVLQALSSRHEVIQVHTGQHYDDNMSAIFFRELEIPEPDVHLGVGSGSHARQTAAIIEQLEPVLAAERPAGVVIYGDTNSTLAAAVVAAKLALPIAHVEAGLRSFNRAMPEEQNRVVADHLSSILFCPTDTAVRNLAAEGITSGVHQVGDVMEEALVAAASRARSSSTVLSRLGLVERGYLLVTVHRAENTENDGRLRQVLDTLNWLESRVIFPMHPRTRLAVERVGWRAGPRLTVIEPQGYLDMLQLTAAARVVLTDSGGLQKEAHWLGVPCVTLRDETEWTETLAEGRNMLAGADSARIMRLARTALELPVLPASRPPAESPSRRIAAVIDAAW